LVDFNYGTILRIERTGISTLKNRDFAWYAVIIILSFGLMGFSLKFTTLFERVGYTMVIGEVYSVCYGLKDQSTITFNDAEHSTVTLQGNFIDRVLPGTDYTIIHSEGWWFPAWPNIGDAVFIFSAALMLLYAGLFKGNAVCNL